LRNELGRRHEPFFAVRVVRITVFLTVYVGIKHLVDAIEAMQQELPAEFPVKESVLDLIAEAPQAAITRAIALSGTLFEDS
jgi:hypothetical protein